MPTRHRVRGALRALVILPALVVAGLGVAAPAHALTVPTPSSSPDCRTVTTQLKDRPDSGNHGTWALDTFTRTVKICRDTSTSQPLTATDTVEIQTNDYHADITDNGVFITVAGAGNSPNAGHAVAGGVHGVMTGHFTADFTAAHDWGFFDASKLDGKTLSGAAGVGNPTTSDWVRYLWTDTFKGSSINDDWAWLYQTCVTKIVNHGFREYWIDSVKTKDGTLPTAGDITGKMCPSPSPSASPTPSASHSPIPPVLTGGGGSLPVTGSRVTWLAGAGGLAVLLGAGLLVLVRRRRADDTGEVTPA